MQSPEKLRQHLEELLGPPGPDADPLELTLRTVVSSTAPMVEGLIEQWPPEQLDRGLEHVAAWFLRIRSDGEAFSHEFLAELGRMQSEAATYELPQEKPAELAPAEPPAAPAPAAPAAPVTPAPGPADVPPAATPPAATPPAPSEPATGDTPPAPSEPATGDTPPPSSSSSEESSAKPPAPPWG